MKKVRRALKNAFEKGVIKAAECLAEFLPQQAPSPAQEPEEIAWKGRQLLADDEARPKRMFRSYVGPLVRKEGVSAGTLELIQAVSDKRKGPRLVDFVAKSEGLAVRSPRELRAAAPIRELDPGGLGDDLIVKPRMGAANRGVFVLSSRDGRWYDSVRKSHFTWPELVATYEAELEALKPQLRYSTSAYIEERVRDDKRGDIPLDYRFYCFWGKVALIQQRDCNGGKEPEHWRFRYYNGNWKDVGPVRGPNGLDSTLEPPALKDEALHAARVISLYVPLPFIRVDLYITPKDLIFGELTPLPGSYRRYDLATDRKMGRLWRDAERRLARSRYPERDMILRVLQGREP